MPAQGKRAEFIVKYGYNPFEFDTWLQFKYKQITISQNNIIYLRIAQNKKEENH